MLRSGSGCEVTFREHAFQQLELESGERSLMEKNHQRLRGVGRGPTRGARGLMVAAALGVSCAGPRPWPKELESALSGCPDAFDDGTLSDLAVYARCPLPADSVKSVRNDYADDELEPPDYAALDAFAGRVPREKFEYQLRTFVNPNHSLLGWFRLDTDGLEPDLLLAPKRRVALAPPLGRPVEAAAGTLQAPVEADRAFRAERQVELRAAARPRLPLAGLRVLIDPGHFGGRYAAFEQRRFEWPEGSAAGLPAIQEGNLTLRTAIELATKLEARGARVLLTRMALEPTGGPDLVALRPFANRLLRHLALDEPFATARASLRPEARTALDVAAALFAIRKQFIFETLRARMRRSSTFEPDVTISLHFNAGPWEGARSAEEELVAMVRGNVGASRAYNPTYRARALRDALAIDEFNAAAHLGALCLRAMSRTLDLPVSRKRHYADHVPIYAADGEPSGVAAWNGAVLRYATGPAVLLEGPYMNEVSELPKLLDALRSPIGHRGTRTEQYASGVAQGLEDWARRWMAQERNDFGPEGLGMPAPGR